MEIILKDIYGNIIDENDMILILNKNFNDNNYGDGFSKDEIINKINNDELSINDSFISYVDYENGDFLYCGDCGRLIDNDDGVYVNDEFYCNDCVEENCFYCSGCQEWYIRGDVSCYSSTNNDNLYCGECAYNIGVCCDCGRCGEDVQYEEDEDEYYCSSCRPSSPLIKSYHDAPELRFYKLDNENTELFYGFELEIEQGTWNLGNEEEAQKIKNIVNDFLYFERDGSLNSGFEIISHPFTFNYFKNNIANKFEKVLKMLSEDGYKSHDTSTCGLHFHISRRAFGDTIEKQDENINKLILFTEYYKDHIIKIARRSSQHYVKFLSDYYDDTSNIEEKAKSIDFIKDHKRPSRYLVINDTNTNTVEFRLCRGTLNFNTFMSSLEFINNLVNCIINNKLTKINFSRVINYYKTDYLKAYLKERGVKYNYNYLKDYSNELNKKINFKIKKYNLIKNDIFNLNNNILNVINELLKNNDYINYLKDDDCNTEYNSSLLSNYHNLIYLINRYELREACESGYIKNNIDYIIDNIKHKLKYFSNILETIKNNNILDNSVVDEFINKIDTLKEGL